MPRSCGNRHCPQCQGHKAKQWLQSQLEKLLPCVYFLVTFTLPKELRRFVRAHPRECYRAMFDAASATLTELARNAKYIGSSKLVGNNLELPSSMWVDGTADAAWTFHLLALLPPLNQTCVPLAWPVPDEFGANRSSLRSLPLIHDLPPRAREG